MRLSTHQGSKLAEESAESSIFEVSLENAEPGSSPGCKLIALIPQVAFHSMARSSDHRRVSTLSAAVAANVRQQGDMLHGLHATSVLAVNYLV